MIWVIFRSVRHREFTGTLCVPWMKMEISVKRIMVLKNDGFSVLFWKTQTVAPEVELLSSSVVHLWVMLRRLQHISFLYFQACWGGGEVYRPASAPSADVSGQTNHQQRDGAGKDEEGRATDAAAKPCSSNASGTKQVLTNTLWVCYTVLGLCHIGRVCVFILIYL